MLSTFWQATTIRKKKIWNNVYCYCTPYEGIF